MPDAKREKALLDFVLSLAKDHGWAVFPIQNGGKRPYFAFKWRRDSSNDAATITGWAKLYPGCNWAMDCGKSDLCVVDVDVKKGAPGLDSLAALREQMDLPATFQTWTPSGGHHLIYKGATASAKPLPGIDIKSSGGYVLLPGSRLAPKNGGGEYSKSSDWEVPPVSTPAALKALIGAPREKAKKTDLPPELLDNPINVKQAISFLTDRAPEAVEGDGGDGQTLKTALIVRDYAISEETCLALLLEHYNPKCSPPWGAEDLQTKVANAYRYAENPQGKFSVDTLFPDNYAPDFFDDEVSSTLAANRPTQAPTNGADSPKKELAPLSSCSFRLCDIIPQSIPRRPWVMLDRTMRGFITVTISPGGVGKSTLTTLEAMAVAFDLPLTGHAISAPGPCLIYNAEDPADELKIRAEALCLSHNLPMTNPDIHFLSGRDLELVFARQQNHKFEINETNFDRLTQFLGDNRIIQATFDPFVALHHCDENDNMAMNHIAQRFSQIAHKCQCAVNLVHHTRKRASGNSGGAGDADSARGASSLVSAARVAHTLSPMSLADAKALEVSEHRRFWYLRLDSAKANMSAPQTRNLWFKRESVTTANQEQVGSIMLTNEFDNCVIRVRSAAEEAVLSALYKAIPADMALPLATAAIILSQDAAVKTALVKASSSTLRRKLQDTFLATPQEYGDVVFETRTFQQAGKSCLEIFANPNPREIYPDEEDIEEDILFDL